MIETAIDEYKKRGEHSCKSVYYLSVVPDASLGLDRRWRLDVILERKEDPISELSSVKARLILNHFVSSQSRLDPFHWSEGAVHEAIQGRHYFSPP